MPDYSTWMDVRKAKEFTVDMMQTLTKRHPSQVFMAIFLQLVVNGPELLMLAQGTLASPPWAESVEFDAIMPQVICE